MGFDFWNGPYFVEQVLKTGGVRIRVDHETVLCNQRDLKPVHIPEYPPPDIMTRAYANPEEEEPLLQEVKEVKEELKEADPLQHVARSLDGFDDRGVACYDVTKEVNKSRQRKAKDLAVARLTSLTEASG
jgi:hypothetical protein